MRNFVLGVVVTLAVLILGTLAYLMLGFWPTNADATPSSFESRIMMNAMDASMDRNAPHINNPIPPTDDNLLDGMKIYHMNCALCHGDLDMKPSPLEKAMYPGPPQLLLEPLDDPEWHLFYAVRTGVRYTGMPAWENVLSKDDMWKVTGFLSRIEKLPAGVEDYWKKTYGVAPQPGKQEGGGEGHHHDHD